MAGAAGFASEAVASCITAALLPAPSPAQAWLVALYLDCPGHIGITCPNSTAVGTDGQQGAKMKIKFVFLQLWSVSQ